MLETSGHYWIAARPPALKPSNGLIDDLGSRWLGSSAGFSGYKCIMGKKLWYSTNYDFLSSDCWEDVRVVEIDGLGRNTKS